MDSYRIINRSNGDLHFIEKGSLKEAIEAVNDTFEPIEQENIMIEKISDDLYTESYVLEFNIWTKQ